METSEGVLAFWFGTQTEDTQVAAQQSALWWNKDPQADASIRERFAPTLAQAVEGRLDSWLKEARSRLALILLTDQFPRNMFRDTPQAFEYDALARTWCRSGLEQGADRSLRPIERVFFYLPLEHSESLADQELSVRLFEGLHAELPPALQPLFLNYLDFARRHFDIIARFGRFPHRNRILGRESTNEELEFLQQPGSGF